MDSLSKSDGQSSYQTMVMRNIEENRAVLRRLGFIPSEQKPKLKPRPVKNWPGIVCSRKTNNKHNVVVQGLRMKTRRSASVSTFDSDDSNSINDTNDNEENYYRPNKIKSEPIFGEIEGVRVGDWWPSRLDCSAAGVHKPTVAGIHGKQNEGCYSIALSGGYEDDLDCGNYFTYTGCGGRDLKGTKANPKNLRTAPQTKDQSLEGLNAALATNTENKKPVRVIRGYKLQSPFAPEEGYRYDGLYSVEKYWTATGLSGFKVYKYALKRIADQDPPPWEFDPSSEVSVSEETQPVSLEITGEQEQRRRSSPLTQTLPTENIQEVQATPLQLNLHNSQQVYPDMSSKSHLKRCSSTSPQKDREKHAHSPNSRSVSSDIASKLTQIHCSYKSPETSLQATPLQLQSQNSQVQSPETISKTPSSESNLKAPHKISTEKEQKQEETLLHIQSRRRYSKSLSSEKSSESHQERHSSKSPRTISTKRGREQHATPPRQKTYRSTSQSVSAEKEQESKMLNTICLQRRRLLFYNKKKEFQSRSSNSSSRAKEIKIINKEKQQLSPNISGNATNCIVRNGFSDAEITDYISSSSVNHSTQNNSGTVSNCLNGTSVKQTKRPDEEMIKSPRKKIKSSHSVEEYCELEEENYQVVSKSALCNSYKEKRQTTILNYFQRASLKNQLKNQVPKYTVQPKALRSNRISNCTPVSLSSDTILSDKTSPKHGVKNRWPGPTKKKNSMCSDEKPNTNKKLIKLSPIKPCSVILNKMTVNEINKHLGDFYGFKDSEITKAQEVINKNLGIYSDFYGFGEVEIVESQENYNTFKGFELLFFLESVPKNFLIDARK